MNQEKIIDPATLVGNRITDAQQWAKSFIQRIKLGFFSKDDIDESLMIGWFANAIETAKDSVVSVNSLIEYNEDLDQLNVFFKKPSQTEAAQFCGIGKEFTPYGENSILTLANLTRLTDTFHLIDAENVCRRCGRKYEEHGVIFSDEQGIMVEVCPNDWILTNSRKDFAVVSDIFFKDHYIKL